jgi:hypothetical protein
MPQASANPWAGAEFPPFPQLSPPDFDGSRPEPAEAGGTAHDVAANTAVTNKTP